METIKTTFKIVDLNNKSRQGQYIYIKTKGQRPSYYKYDPDIKIDYYLQYYQQKSKSLEKKKGISIKKHLKTYQAVETGQITTIKDKTKTQAQRYMKKISKQYGGKTIEQIVKRGIANVTINDTFRASNATVFKANTTLLSEMILDKKIRDVMATEENMKKLSNRLEQRIILIGENGKHLSEFNVIGKTTNQVNSDMNSIFHRGEHWAKTGINGKLATLNSMGYNKPTLNEEGNIQRIQVTTILRKAK